jgi:type II secretory pathway component PulJ
MEVLLALAVSAIVLAAIGGVFFSALRLRDRTTAMLDESAPLQQALSFIRRDLQGVIPGDGEMAGNFEAGAGEAGMGDDALIRFRTTTALLKENAPWGEVQEVAYQLRPSALQVGVGKDLIRSVTHNLLATAGTEVEDQYLLGNVQTLEFACYDGANWQNSWDTSAGTTPWPSAVRVRLQMAGPGGAPSREEQPLEMIVPLVAQSRTNQVVSSQ